MNKCNKEKITEFITLKQNTKNHTWFAVSLILDIFELSKHGMSYKTFPIKKKIIKYPDSNCLVSLTDRTISVAGSRYFSFPVQNAWALPSPLSMRNWEFGITVNAHNVAQTWIRSSVSINNSIVKEFWKESSWTLSVMGMPVLNRKSQRIKAVNSVRQVGSAFYTTKVWAGTKCSDRFLSFSPELLHYLSAGISYSAVTGTHKHHLSVLSAVLDCNKILNNSWVNSFKLSQDVIHFSLNSGEISIVSLLTPAQTQKTASPSHNEVSRKEGILKLKKKSTLSE